MNAPRWTRRAVRDTARALTAVSAVMLLTSVWLSLDPGLDRASAAPVGGTARIVHPSSSPNPGELLAAGGSDTDFVLQLPLGAACSGDNATDGYLVHSYMVPANVDPADVTFGPAGPTPPGTGADFRQPLWDPNGSPYTAAFPDIDTATITGIPVFDFSVYGAEGPSIVPEGSYNAGIACVAPPVEDGGTWTLDRYWNVELAVVHDAGDVPSGFTWTVASSQAVATSLALSADPAETSSLGDEVTLTAVVTPADAAGTVTFLDGTTKLGTEAVAGGTASLVTSSLAVGSHDLSAAFAPTDEAAFTASAATIQYLVTAGETTVTLTVDPPSTAVEGAPVTLTATVAPEGATGTVSFEDNGQVLNSEPVPVTAGSGTFTTTTLAEGEHTLTAAFTPTPESGFDAAESAPLTYTVTAASVTIALEADPPSEAVVGEPVTLTATVSLETAEGTVTFAADTDPLAAAVPLDEGQATLTVDDLPVGEHDLTATFTAAEGSALDDATSEPLAYEVTAAAATTTTTTATTTTSPTTTQTTTPPAALPETATPPVASPSTAAPSGTGSLGTLPVTGGPVAIAGWGALLMLAGRVAVLVGRPGGSGTAEVPPAALRRRRGRQV